MFRALATVGGGTGAAAAGFASVVGSTPIASAAAAAAPVIRVHFPDMIRPFCPSGRASARRGGFLDLRTVPDTRILPGSTRIADMPAAEQTLRRTGFRTQETVPDGRTAPDTSTARAVVETGIP